MDEIATNSLDGQETSYGDLRLAAEEAVGGDFEWDQVRAQLSWIAKYCKSIMGEPVWPLEVSDRGPDSEKGDRYSYVMPKPLARGWLGE